MIPIMTLLLKDIKALEDYARACLSKEEERMVLVTREEADVLRVVPTFYESGDRLIPCFSS